MVTRLDWHNKTRVTGILLKQRLWRREGEEMLGMILQPFLFFIQRGGDGWATMLCRHHHNFQYSHMHLRRHKESHISCCIRAWHILSYCIRLHLAVWHIEDAQDAYYGFCQRGDAFLHSRALCRSVFACCGRNICFFSTMPQRFATIIADSHATFETTSFVVGEIFLPLKQLTTQNKISPLAAGFL